MIRGLTCAGVLAALAVVPASAEDLAWRFDTSARPADAVAETTAAPSAAVDVLPSATGESGTIPLFDSRWMYSIQLDGWTYQFVRGFCIIVR